MGFSTLARGGYNPPHVKVYYLLDLGFIKRGLTAYELPYLGGHALAWAWASWRLGRAGVPAWRYLLFPSYLIPAVSNGAHLFAWLTFGRPAGFVLYGGLFGALAASALAWWLLYRPWLSAARWFDDVMASLLMVMGMLRVGCHLAGCCHGTPAPPGWPSVTYASELMDTTPYPEFRDIPLHPAVLYEAAGMALLLVAAALLRRRLRPGEQGWLLLSGYAAVRFLLEFIRADPRGGTVLGLYPSQVISLAVLAVAALAAWPVRRPESAP